MPGIEKRLARYPQLYSRVGFVHHYRPLSAEEQAFVLARNWPGLHLAAADFTTGEAVAAITRITSGNFRLTGRAPFSAGSLRCISARLAPGTTSRNHVI